MSGIYFEGGEPFLYYPILVKGVHQAAEMGFKVGLVSNGFWATSLEDAIEWLKPFEGLVQDLSVSSDLYHWSEKFSEQAKIAEQAAKQLGIALGVIAIAQPEQTSTAASQGQLPIGESAVMYRGRAVEKLVAKAELHPWSQFEECPHEDLNQPGRVHVDPFGNLHICQGISIGNLFQTPLREICSAYDAEAHPITGLILKGGPAELVRQFELTHEQSYADACHLCDSARRALRDRLGDYLLPEQMYRVNAA